MREQALFEKYKEGRHWEKHPAIHAERFVQFLKEQHFDDTLVDVGCGSGRDVGTFTDAGLNAIGIDILPGEIKLAQQRYPTCHFEVQDIEHLKFKENSIGAFFAINVIHYVDKKTALKEILRTLKPGGFLFIHFNLSITDKDGKTDYSQDEKEIEQLVSHFTIVKKTNFERVDLQPIKHTHKILELVLIKPC